jgi:hypothetical protein
MAVNARWALAAPSEVSTMMILNPIRLYRRHQRLVRDAMEEVQHLRRRHGAQAVEAARAKLQRPEITSWGRRVMQRAIKVLKTQG